MNLLTKMQWRRGVGRVVEESGSREVGGLGEVEENRRPWVDMRGVVGEGSDSQGKESIAPCWKGTQDKSVTGLTVVFFRWVER